MDISLIGGSSPLLLPLATSNGEKEKGEENIQSKIGAKRRIEVREKEERIDNNGIKNKKMRYIYIHTDIKLMIIYYV